MSSNSITSLSQDVGPIFHSDLEFKNTNASKVDQLTLSTNGLWAYSLNEDNTIHRWNNQTKNEHLCISKHKYKKGIVAISPDGQRILSEHEDNSLRLWDVETGYERHSLRGHIGKVLCVTFSKDGKWALTGCVDKTVRLWNCLNGKERFCYQGHTDRVTCVAFTDSGLLISGSADKTIRLWKTCSDKELGSFLGHTSTVSCLAFFQKRACFVSGGEDCTIRIWDVLSKREIFCSYNHGGVINAVGTSPDGKWLLSGADDNTVRLWNYVGEQVLCLRGHTRGVTSVAFSFDNQSVFYSSDGNEIKKWEIEGTDKSKHTISWIKLFPKKASVRNNMDSKQPEVESISPKKSLSEWIITSQLHSIIYISLPLLTFQELLFFEQANSHHRHLTEHAWKMLRKGEWYQFAWKACKNERQNDKWNYCLSKALKVHLDKIKTISPIALTELISHYAKFQSLVKKFPTLSSFVYSQTSLEGELGESLRESVVQGYGGESLLVALSALHTYKVAPTSENLQMLTDVMIKAIQNGATVGGLFILDHVDDKVIPDTPLTLHKLFALVSMAKGDWRALEKIKDKFSIAFIKQYEQSDYPPFLLQLAQHYFTTEKNEAKSFELCTKAINLYGPSAPLMALQEAGITLAQLNKKKEAIQVFNQALKIYGKDLPPTLLSLAAFAKFVLHSWEEAEELFTQSLDAYQGNPQPLCLFQLARVKLKRGKSKEAEFFIDKYLEIIGSKITSYNLFEAGLIKAEVGKFPDSYHLFNKAIESSKGKIPTQFTTIVQKVKDKASLESKKDS